MKVTTDKTRPAASSDTHEYRRGFYIVQLLEYKMKSIFFQLDVEQLHNWPPSELKVFEEKTQNLYLKR